MAINNSNISTQMRKGMLEYCVLLILSKGRAYASDILRILEESHTIVVEGSLYTLLNRLKREQFLDYCWEESPKGPPRKYYSLTPQGLELLSEMSAAWDSLANTIDTLRREASRDLLDKEEELKAEISDLGDDRDEWVQ